MKSNQKRMLAHMKDSEAPRRQELLENLSSMIETSFDELRHDRKREPKMGMPASLKGMDQGRQELRQKLMKKQSARKRPTMRPGRSTPVKSVVLG